MHGPGRMRTAKRRVSARSRRTKEIVPAAQVLPGNPLTLRSAADALGVSMKPARPPRLSVWWPIMGGVRTRQ